MFFRLVRQDQDGRAMRGDGRKLAHKPRPRMQLSFNIFQDISSEDDDGELDKERGLTVEQILERSPKYADKFLDKVKPLLVEPKVSKSAAGGAFTMLEAPNDRTGCTACHDCAKTVQRHVRKCRTALKLNSQSR
eukprot:Skav234416  [mRNA]  locus=scaffold4957:896:1951:+ [translate_table: standard]